MKGYSWVCSCEGTAGYVLMRGYRGMWICIVYHLLFLLFVTVTQAFKMESKVSGKFVYGGVLQFTSPSPDSAYLPQWMIEHLQVQEGDEVSFEHVDLPKGQFVRLQPVSSSWLVSW